MSHKAPTLLLLIFLLSITSCQPVSSPTTGQANPTSKKAYIENKGSDTLVNLALAWAERYQKLNPEVQISVTGGGSGTGFASLMNGTIDIANASRKIKPEEIETAREKGFEPIEFIVANDAIAVIVNPHNPVNQLTLEQVSMIYKGEITNWQALGGEDRPIVKLSRETNSGTHVYFLETVVRLGKKGNEDIFSADTLLLPSSEGIIAEVRDNPNAIGYDGLGYVTDEVKMVALSKDGSGYIIPSVETVLNGMYPISRHLYMYTRGEPQGAELEYLQWILSSDAQEITAKLGFVPVLSE
ncbi:MAG: PstS family phosphate ABC transporter substrate-binding protein [Anaerolineaceae bacterium]|nr:PstS family phosphate ABC transporter substrate-binding protein [Anaerolineaceae bacterium]